MKIHPAAQGSLEWMCARAGIPTASEFDALVTPEFKIRTGEMPKTYLAKKVAEAWMGSPLIGTAVWDMDQGKILEEEARPGYTFQTGIDVKKIGLITTDDGKIGCSPDGLIGEDSGIEIKCPQPDTHVKYLLNGTVPKDYLAQIHGAIYVTGRPRWVFMSWCRHFPELIVTVERDEEIQEKLHEALSAFIAEMDKAMNRLTDINGGPPRRREIKERAKQRTISEMPS